MIPDSISCIDNAFWVAMAECLLFGITDLIRHECPRCRKNNLKCRTKHDFSLHHYKNTCLQYTVFIKFYEPRNHILHHMEQYLVFTWPTTYSTEVPHAVYHYSIHPERFEWAYLYKNLDILNHYIEMLYNFRMKSYGSILNWVREHNFLGDIHNLLEFTSQNLPMASIEIKGNVLEDYAKKSQVKKEDS